MADSMDIELLRCSVCNGYLSCTPITVLHDGASICSRCSPSYDEDELSRQFVLEKLISKVYFPCIFKTNGCEEKLLFGAANDHEPNCLYRSVDCPLIPNSCPWEGPIQQIHPHFTKEHPKHLLKPDTFNLPLNGDRKGIGILLKDCIPFVIPYIYSAVHKTFYYSVRYYQASVDGALCNIWLTNAAEPEYCVRFKGCECAPYGRDLFDTKVTTIVYINDYLQILNNPTSIIFTFKLSVSKAVPREPQVDYELLEKIRCNGCQNFLVPPIFDSKRGTVCSGCCDGDSKPSKNEILKELLTKIGYPCSWRDCKFVGNSSNIQSHQNTCKLRQYRCFVPKFHPKVKCSTTFTQIEAIEHLQLHKFEHFVDKYVYKTAFKTVYFKTSYEFTIIDGEFIVLERTGSPCCHFFRVWTSDADPAKFVAGATFEHAHCALKSKEFRFVADFAQFSVVLKDLPACFDSQGQDELYVTVRIYTVRN